MNHLDLANHKAKKSDTFKPPQNRGFYWKMDCLSFGPPIQDDKRTT
jgi:hypothetical protein